MTKKELEQLIDLQKEIKELEQSILKIKQMDIGEAPVKVNASRQNFPYTQSKTTVHGYDPVLADKRSRRLYEKRVLLDERKKKAAEEERRLLCYINGIEESRIRRIMQFRYIEGLTWEKIGDIMHCDRTTVEKMITRYIKNSKSK
ncbi:MAG: hypothetical protein K2O91_26110 [Lachnospiraceae bacterium]|nr:hypothetical protein [Lachnospiraceae bacterium]